MRLSRYRAEYAWLGGPRAQRDVLIDVDGERFGAVTPVTEDNPAPPDAVPLAGLTVPGLADAHSHAFHRALRGRTHAGGGDFWSWRDLMYRVADRLDPDSYHALASAVFAELALAGVTCVGEFHYLHHAPGGGRYADPNAMGTALIEAARTAGIRITVLDTCYLTSTVDGAPVRGPQVRFSDGTADAWASRVDGLADTPYARIGAAVHSVRAVPVDQLPAVAAWAAGRQAPLHVHLSEQPAENEACLARHGRTPTRLLADAGLLGPRTTAVHATHLTADDIGLLGGSGTSVCLCPTTERDLADGIGPAGALAGAGSPLCLGSDSHAVIDLFEEARAVELDERLATGRRGRFAPDDLLHAATAAGHRSLGWPDAGMIAPGMRADLVTVRLDSVRTAGLSGPEVIFAASAADVTQVMVDGRRIVLDGVHRALPDVAQRLAHLIKAVL